jgi:acyl-CoA dehydrogenase
LTFVRFPDDYIGAIIVDTDTPGFDVQEPMPSMAGSPESFISINDARVPEENVVVKGRDGLRNLMSAYNLERMGGASLYWGTAKCAFDRALKYAQEREQFGKAIGENQAITHKLSQMAVNLETARLLIYKCVSKDELPTMLESSITKVHIGDIVNQVADEALQIRGARGYVGDPPEDWMYRYLRQTKITGGTREIHLNNIANALFEKGDLPDY